MSKATAVRVTTPTTSIEVVSMTFAESRALILSSLAQMRAGQMSAAELGATLASMKMLNDSISAEINVHKLCLATEGKANSFGKAVAMGQAKLLG